MENKNDLINTGAEKDVIEVVKVYNQAIAATQWAKWDGNEDQYNKASIAIETLKDMLLKLTKEKHKDDKRYKSESKESV